MKARYTYAILFVVPGLLASLIVAAMLGFFILGLAWFVFGDNPTPTWVERLTVLIGLGVFAVASLFWVVVGYLIGKKREAQQKPVLRSHYLASLLVTAVILGLLLFRAVIVPKMNTATTTNLQNTCVVSASNECCQKTDCVGIDWKDNQPTGCMSWNVLSRIEYEKGQIVADWPCKCVENECQSL